MQIHTDDLQLNISAAELLCKEILANESLVVPVDIPVIGKIVVGESKPYEYLIKSIENFVNQEELTQILKKNKFYKPGYRNLSGGIVSIHSGWKI